jgi:2-polyprenyl-6-methoxyphenol hydroxylase-like FAD-dependent oxidoreductase
MAIAKEPPNNAALPIIIAGGGCVGLFLALLLAQSPLPNPILVVEPQHPDPTSTRAMAHQPPTFPLFAQIPGLLPELIAAGSLSEGLCFRTSVGNGSRVIASKTFENGGEGMKGKGQLLLPQGEFQRVLLGRLERIEGVEVRLGWSVDDFTQGEDGSKVAVQISGPEGKTEEIDAAYLVGADGAHSRVRKCMGVELSGETLDAQLVATDLRFPFKSHGFFDANFVVDKADYGLIGRIDNAGLWRLSYGVPGSSTEEDIRRTLDEKLRTMLPNNGKDEAGNDAFEVVRVAPYRAQQRCADTMTSGRVLLVGDAAHCKSPRHNPRPERDSLTHTVTNPYAGLGLASGIADADALAPVLAHILSGKASDADQLLSSWSDARRQKFADVIDKPSRMAYARVKSKVDSQDEVEALLARDPMVRALKSGMPVMPPSLRTVGEELAGW